MFFRTLVLRIFGSESGGHGIELTACSAQVADGLLERRIFANERAGHFDDFLLLVSGRLQLLQERLLNLEFRFGGYESFVELQQASLQLRFSAGGTSHGIQLRQAPFERSDTVIERRRGRFELFARFRYLDG